MNRNELLAQLKRRQDRDSTRKRNELAILAHLPEGLDINRITADQSDPAPGSCVGGIEAQFRNYGHVFDFIDTTPEFKPIDVARVRMDRTNTGPTTSFYPTARIPAKWTIQHEVLEIHPIIFQAQPVAYSVHRPDSQTARVYLEWFIEPKEGIVVNVRAVVEDHPVYYNRRAENKPGELIWRAMCVPRGEVRCVNLSGPDKPPMVTVYWWPGMAEGPDYGLLDLLLEREGNYA